MIDSTNISYQLPLCCKNITIINYTSTWSATYYGHSNDSRVVNYVLQSSITLLENIYSTGVTRDDCHITMAKATGLSVTKNLFHKIDTWWRQRISSSSCRRTLRSSTWWSGSLELGSTNSSCSAPRSPRPWWPVINITKHFFVRKWCCCKIRRGCSSVTKIFRLL